jgi:Fe-S-cluster containining protein
MDLRDQFYDAPAATRAHLVDFLRRLTSTARDQAAFGLTRTTPVQTAAANLMSLIDTTTAHARSHHACRDGCSWCCYHPIGVSPVEALFIAFLLNEHLPTAQREPLIEQMRRRRDQVAEIPSSVIYRRLQLPCVFLDAGRCRIYQFRPIVCRGYNALDADACAASHGNPEHEVPSDLSSLYASSAILLGMEHACQSAGKQHRLLELSHAVLMALEQPALMAAWLAGEDVFGECAGAFA